MATKVSTATGNFTASGTWSPIDSGSELDSEAASTASTTSFVYSATFTPGNTQVVGVAVKIAARIAAPAGTITITLANNTSAGTREGTTVINVSDIDASGLGWYLFTFSSPPTPNGTDVYKVGFRTSIAAEATLYRNATAANWSRMLLLGTTTTAPTTGDKLMMMGSWTGAGSLTSYTVTLNDTSATVYGPTVSGGPPQGMTVNKGATLTCGTTASTAYTLYWLGILGIYGGATVNVGTSGTPIPSTSSAILQMNSVANADSGIQVNSGATVNMYGNAAVSSASYQTKATSDIGGICSTTNVANSIVTASLGQSFTGLTGTIVINGSNFTISSVQTSTQLTLTGNAGALSNVSWTHPGTAVTLNVISTSGWANNDVLCVAGTSRTPADCESVTVSSVNSSTQVTLSAALTKPHSGTAYHIINTVNSPGGGTFTLTWNGNTTATLNYNASAGDIQTALGNLAGLSGNVTCSGGPLPSNVIVQFAGSAYAQTILPITATYSGLTGGASPAVQIALFDTRAEVGHLTRNVKVRGISTSLQGYVNIGTTAAIPMTTGAVAFQNVEFYQLGSATVTKTGIFCNVTSPVTANFQYCSLHDYIVAGSIGLAENNASINSLTINNCVAYNCAASCFALQIAGNANASWTISGCLAMLTATSHCFHVLDQSGTFTNNTAVGATSPGQGMLIQGTSARMSGTFSNLTCHTCGNVGMIVAGINFGTMTGINNWRNVPSAIQLGVSPFISGRFNLVSGAIFGNSTAGIQGTVLGNNIILQGLSVNGDIASTSPFIQASGLSLAGTSGFLITDSMFGAQVAHSTQDLANASIFNNMDFENCYFGSTRIRVVRSDIYGSRTGSQYHQQQAGNYLTWKDCGILTVDTVIARAGSRSLKMIPFANNITNPGVNYNLDSKGRFGWFVPVRAGVAPTVSVYARESVAADQGGTCNTSSTTVTWVSGQKFSGMSGNVTINGVSYTISSVTNDLTMVLTGTAGTQTGVVFGQAYGGIKAQLVVNKNSGIGITSSTVIATATAADVGAWELLSGTAPTPTDDGVMELYVQCNGTTGWVNVDSFTGG